MKVFDFSDYRSFIRKRLELMPKQGHGQLRRIASHLKIQSSMLSQIMSGHRDMSPEMGSLLCEYLGLNELETDYFLTLIQYERAGSPSLRKILNRQREKLRQQGNEITHRISKKLTLSDEARAIFYSQWYYSGVRICSAIPELGSMDQIAAHLGLPTSLVSQVVEFLLAHGLCKMDGNRLQPGPQSTHLPGHSPLVARHHVNWRLKSMEGFGSISPEELVFTGPCAISREDGEKVRKILLDAIDQWTQVVDTSGSEDLCCLNIDWVKIK